MPPEDPPPERLRLDIRGTTGSIVHPQYVERDMTFYAVPEHELRSISMMNTLAIFFFSGASSFLAFFAGIRVEVSLQDPVTPQAAAISATAEPICIIGAIVCGLLGGWALVHRGSMLKTIRNESRVISGAGAGKEG